MNKGLNVHSEIGALKKVCVHRPGMDLVNMKAEDFDRVWIHDAFYLDYAQKEHDQLPAFFAALAPRSSIWKSCSLRRLTKSRALAQSS